ncbi:hypothetical protein B0H63DRAFT_449351 [Podospora didyma]|uniref:Uncharacterized protein n=1 Tax=Podospora didyma TaxID=330526 RepID=A0AAE0TZE1_9PEZI|nr:hypothetical protein B0H63DRAFT_449351 [Podospora didyma]
MLHSAKILWHVFMIGLCQRIAYFAGHLASNTRRDPQRYLTIFESPPSLELMINLPVFNLQSMLEKSAAACSLNQVLSEIFQHPFGLAAYRVSWATQTCKFNLRAMSASRYDGELPRKIQDILDPSSSLPVGLSSLFGVTAFFASNNHLKDD